MLFVTVHVLAVIYADMEIGYETVPLARSREERQSESAPLSAAKSGKKAPFKC